MSEPTDNRFYREAPATPSAKLPTCKDCPYWDDAPLRATSPRSTGLCRYNAPVASNGPHDFPETYDSDWCRPGREAMAQPARDKARIDTLLELFWGGDGGDNK